MKKIFLLILLLLNAIISQPQVQLVLKLKDNEKNDINIYIKNLTEKYAFKEEYPFKNLKIEKDKSLFSDIRKIRIFHVKENNVEYLINKLNKKSIIEYCEKKDIPVLLYQPDDPGIASQYYLNNISAYQAWDIYKGDTNVVIGIVDTGTDLVHEDLWKNISFNWNDIIDGYDNDGDGYVDNFWGWDIGDNDNSPQWSENKISPDPHGVYVAGFSSATPDNGKGIAGIGFKTRFLPVKIKDSLGILSRAYEGVVYAADHDCKIINCSWGSTTPTRFAKDIINFVTYDKKCLIVAAAGNNGNTLNSVYYPAAYDNVVCVAATNQNNQKWIKSCYGKHIDVCAPGEAVYTTFPQNSYGMGWGTSFAAPMVAAQAALIYGYYNKNLHPLQIKAIIEHTAINIDTIQGNQAYSGLLGKGLINLKNSLIQRPDKYVHLVDYYSYVHNDTTKLSIIGINLFKPLNNLKLTLYGDNEVNVINESINYGFVDSLQFFNKNNENVFLLTYKKDKYDIAKELLLKIQDNDFTDYKTINVKLNPSYRDIVNGNLIFTICANGKLGFNDNQNSEGNGLLYKTNESLLSSMGIVILFNSNIYSSALYNDNHFKVLKGTKLFENDTIKYSISEFCDSLNPFSSGITVKLSVLAYKNNENVVELNYTLINNSPLNYDSLFFGLFSDIDILNPNFNVINFNSFLKLMYFEDKNIKTSTVGFILPNTIGKFYYAIDNDGANNSIGITNGINAAILNSLMKKNRYNAGGDYGNDVSCMLSYGPLFLNSGDSVNLKYLMFVASNTEELFNKAFEYLYSTDSIYAPTYSYDEELFISYNSNEILIQNFTTEKINLNVIDLNGRTIFSEEVDTGINKFSINFLSKGIYIISIISQNFNKHYKILKF